jgi:hypothetical protein
MVVVVGHSSSRSDYRVFQFVPFPLGPGFCVVSNPFLSTPAMLLEVFRWNGLYYTRHPAKRAFATLKLEEGGIQAHYNRFALARRGVWITNIRYVLS